MLNNRFFFLRLEFKDLEHLTALLKSVPELTLVKAVHNCKLDFDVQKDYISRASKTWTKEDIGEIYPILKERCVALRTKKTAELKGKLKVGQFGTWTGRDGLTKRGVITKINKTKLKADVRDEDGNISRWTVPISMVTPDAPSKKRPADDLPTKSFKKNKIEL